MSEDHIKEIAAKADQLIEIIQTIKDKVNVPVKSVEKRELVLDEGGNSEENNNGSSWW